MLQNLDLEIFEAHRLWKLLVYSLWKKRVEEFEKEATEFVFVLLDLFGVQILLCVLYLIKVMLWIVPLKEMLSFNGHLVKLLKVQLQFIARHQVEKLFTMTFRISAPLHLVSLVILKQAIDHNFVNIICFVISHVSLKSQEKLFEFVIWPQMGQVEQHPVRVFRVQECYKDQDSESEGRNDDVHKKGVGKSD